MKSLIGLVLILPVFMFSCRSAEEKSASTDTTSVATDHTSSGLSRGDTPVTEIDTMRANVYAANTYREEAAKEVRDKLRKQYKDKLEGNRLDSAARTFMIFEYDLNNDQKSEIFVAYQGALFCDSNSCAIGLVKSNGNPIARFEKAEVPILISKNRTNGWYDLYVMSKGRYHVLKFDGKTYPSNPVTAPVLTGKPSDSLTKVLNYNKEPYMRFHF